LEFRGPAAPQKKALDVNTLIGATLQLQASFARPTMFMFGFFSRTPNLPRFIGECRNQFIQVFS